MLVLALLQRDHLVAEAAVWSPGGLLAAAGIRTALALGCREFDWLRGDEPYKTRWATHQRTLEELDLPVVD